MNRQIIQYGFIPFLFGFLLLGAMNHPAGHREHGARTAAPAAPQAQAPHMLRALTQESDGATIAPLPVYEPLPVYLPAQDDSGCSGTRACQWSI